MAEPFNPFAAIGAAPVEAPGQGGGAAPFNPFGQVGATPVQTDTTTQTRQPNIIGFGMNGEPIYDDPTWNAGMQEASNRFGEKVGEGATFHMLPYAIAGVRALGGTPFGQGLQEARDYTAQTEKDTPGVSTPAEITGSLLPVGGIAKAAQPVLGAIERGVPYVGKYLSGALLGSGIGAGSQAGTELGTGQGDVSDIGYAGLGGGLAGGAGALLGRVLQSGVNVGKEVATGVKNVFTSAGKDATAGQILRESTTNPTTSFARSPLPDLSLRTPQATGDPGLASLERTLAPTEVQGGRTSDQTKELAKALVGSDAGAEPATLVANASSQGTKAVGAVSDALDGVEKKLWSDPELGKVTLDGKALADGVASDVAKLPASFRNAITGPQGTLGAYLDELRELPGDATIADVNSIRSRLLRVGRDAGSGANPDSVTAAAAGQMADSIVTRMGSDPGMTGKAQDAYQAARDFTRQKNQTLGFNEFRQILNPNSAGNIQGNPESMFGRFFDLAGGTGTGLQRLQAASSLARANGATDAADALDKAAQDYAKAALLRSGRAGQGLDKEGLPVTNPASLASTVNRNMPAISGTPITAPVAGDVQAAGNAAELLNRPAASRGDFNSTTFEKLKTNDLVSALMGQTGAAGAGALGGGYLAYEHGPESVPTAIRVPVGMALGAAGGRYAAPYLGHLAAHLPFGISGMVKGPAADVMKRVELGLASPDEYRRLIAAYLLQGPTIGSEGALSRGIPAATQLAIPQVTGRSERP